MREHYTAQRREAEGVQPSHVPLPQGRVFSTSYPDRLSPFAHAPQSKQFVDLGSMLDSISVIRCSRRVGRASLVSQLKCYSICQQPTCQPFLRRNPVRIGNKAAASCKGICCLMGSDRSGRPAAWAVDLCSETKSMGSCLAKQRTVCMLRVAWHMSRASISSGWLLQITLCQVSAVQLVNLGSMQCSE